VLRAALAVFFLVALAGPAGAFAGTRVSVTPQDRTATRALLEAEYTYEQAVVANALASKAAVEELASSLGEQCPAVLAGAPHETLITSLESPARPRSPRQVGESRRERRQRDDLEIELALAVGRSLIAPDQQAALVYAHTIGLLRWSDDALTELERADAAELEWQLQIAPPDVCADMKTWVASGYRTLSTATKTLLREREALDARGHLVNTLGPEPLLPYEGSSEKALETKIEGLGRGTKITFESLVAAETGLQSALGLVSRAEAETEMHEGRPKGSVEIGHGRTAVGASYTVWLEPGRSGSGPRGMRSVMVRCSLPVGVYETESASGGSRVVVTGGGSNEVCLSRSHPQAPSVECRGDEGLLTIEAQTPPGVRGVRLRLSDGRLLASPVAIVPAKLGGPAGFYYQVVRGPSPVPVSLTEVDAHDRTLRIVKLPRTHRCVKLAPKRLSGGHRTIVSGSLPQGPSFSIIDARYSAMGETHLNLSVEVASEGDLGGVSSSSSSGVVGAGPRPKPSPFTLEMATGCQPHEYAILYGILQAPGDTVLARSSGDLVPFRWARIPASLHVRGVLAYIALPGVPSEVLVRTPSGKTVFTEKLGSTARAEKEICEGETEPSN
jgi:hypothetical protein